MRGDRRSPARAPGIDAQEVTVERSRVGLLLSLTIIAFVLSAAVALLIPGIQDQLPRIPGLDFRVVQIGLVLLVLAFCGYTYERERIHRRLSRDLLAQRMQASELAVRLEALEEVQAERDTVAALLLASADGILVVDRDRRVSRTNPALADLIGLDGGVPDGRRCEDLLGCRRGGILQCGDVCPFERVFVSGQTLRDVSLAALAGDGTERWISGAFSSVADKEGSVMFGIGSLRDVTRVKEVEHLQQDFVSIVSHELRGPLTAIKGFVTTLLRSGSRFGPETQVEFLQTISLQADRLNELVENLLSVSRIESRRLHMKVTDVHLELLAKKVVDQFRSKWGDRQVVIEADLDLPAVRADEARIDEVLVNLIDNAVKYSPAGGKVRVQLSRSGDGVVLAVEDSGIGIAPDDAVRLFERFHRVASPETSDIGGTGLGLYIVKSIVEAHGGSIFVTSAPGEGSTFTVELPIRGPAAPAAT